MDQKGYELLKANFLKMYASVPEPLRKEIIAVVDDETFTWQTAKLEIMNNTKHAKIILEHLEKIGVISHGKQ